MRKYNELLTQYSEQIKNNLKTGFNSVAVSTKFINDVITTSEKCEDFESETIGFFIAIIPVYFGVNIENLTTSIFSLSYNALIDRFNGITLNDIDIAFKTSEIIKKDYISLTREELLFPIKEYWIKKQKILDEFRKIEDEVERRKIEEDKVIVFNSEVKKLYLEALKTGVWKGDSYHSNSIVRNYSSYINDEERTILWSKAKKEHEQLLKESIQPEIGIHTENKENKPAYFGSREKVYSVLFMQKIIDKRINWIQE